MPFEIVRNDITRMSVDAIVNAANSQLLPGGGVCGAIFHAAGANELQAECGKIGRCNVGGAVVTKGYALPAKYIIHAVGPIWRGGGAGESVLLHNCYINALSLAAEYKCSSIAFPLISSGIYGYPKDRALQVAVAAISEFLLTREMQVYLVVFDKTAFVLSEKLFSAIERFIDDNYAGGHLVSRSGHEHKSFTRQLFEQTNSHGDASSSIPIAEALASVSAGKRSLSDVVGHLDESFSRMLLRLIDEKGITDVETYKRANIDRKLFSKIRNGKGYNPSKPTAIAFAIALQLNLDETKDLLGKAGYTLSHSNKFDVIIEYFIEEGNYNIFEINEALFAFDQTLLGA